MSAGAFEEDGDAVIEMDLLPPRWVDIQDEVTELLGTIAKKSADLEKLHAKHVLPGFDDEDVKRQEEIAIERLTQEITHGFHDCQRAIQRIEMMVRDARHQGEVSKADETMARNIQISLASRVQEVSTGFRKKQSNYLKSRDDAKALLGSTAANHGSRTPYTRRTYYANRTLLNPFTEPVHRSFHGGIRER